MSLPALPDGIPVFLFLLLVSELFTLSLSLALSRSFNWSQSASEWGNVWPLREFLCQWLVSLLVCRELASYPLLHSTSLPLSAVFLLPLVTLFKKLCFALRLRILMSFRLLRFFNFILKYHLFSTLCSPRQTHVERRYLFLFSVGSLLSWKY